MIFFAVVWGYFVLFETIWHGQSPGKRWTGLRVIQDGGYPIGFSHAAIRNIVRIVDFLPSLYLVGMISVVVVFFSRVPSALLMELNLRGPWGGPFARRRPGFR